MKLTNIQPTKVNLTRSSLLNPLKPLVGKYSEYQRKVQHLNDNASMYSAGYIQEEKVALETEFIQAYETAKSEMNTIYYDAIKLAQQRTFKVDHTKVGNTPNEEIIRQLAKLNTREEVKEKLEYATSPERLAALFDEYHENKTAYGILHRALNNKLDQAQLDADTNNMTQYQRILEELQSVDVPQEVYDAKEQVNITAAFKTLKSYELPNQNNELVQVKL